MSSQSEIRQRITDRIIQALRNGCPPWRKGWSSGGNTLPTNASSRRKYSGVNVALLQLAALERGYQSNLWCSFNQWQKLGARVMKRPADVPPGEYGVKIVFCKQVEKARQTETGEDEVDRFFMLREYTVFSLEQVEGIEKSRFVQPQPRPATAFVDYAPAEQVIAATKADIRHGGDRALYHRSGDFIQMPHKAQFVSEHEYYATAYHELLHWSERRLGWTGSYALGELVAEIGACYLSVETGIPQSDQMDNHNSYVAHWLQELQNDNRAVFRAAAAASKGASFILSFSRDVEGAEAEEEGVMAGAGA
jgi:antirestriction protein ArdC